MENKIKMKENKNETKSTFCDLDTASIIIITSLGLS